MAPSENWNHTGPIHPLFSRGEDLGPECVNAFEFDQGVEVSPTLPAPVLKRYCHFKNEL